MDPAGIFILASILLVATIGFLFIWRSLYGIDENKDVEKIEGTKLGSAYIESRWPFVSAWVVSLIFPFVIQVSFNSIINGLPMLKWIIWGGSFATILVVLASQMFWKWLYRKGKISENQSWLLDRLTKIVISTIFVIGLSVVFLLNGLLIQKELLVVVAFVFFALLVNLWVDWQRWAAKGR